MKGNFMDIRKNDFYYFSYEFYRSSYPTKCRYIKRLDCVGVNIGREAVLIETAPHSSDFSPEYLVVIPRRIEQSLFNMKEDEAVSLFVFDGRKYIDHSKIDPSPDNETPIDIGGISGSLKEAQKWQMNLEDKKASQEYMKQHFPNYNKNK